MLQPIGEGIYDVGPTCEIFFHPVTSPPSLSLYRIKKKKDDDDLFIFFFFLVRKCLSSLHTAAAQSTVKVKCARPSTYLPVVVFKPGCLCYSNKQNRNRLIYFLVFYDASPPFFKWLTNLLWRFFFSYSETWIWKPKKLFKSLDFFDKRARDSFLWQVSYIN